jgi:hypothetical protein
MYWRNILPPFLGMKNKLCKEAATTVAYSLILKMNAVCSSPVPVSFYQTTQHLRT